MARGSGNDGPDETAGTGANKAGPPIDLRTLLESIPDAFLAIDEAWRVVFANRRALELLGQSAELVGRILWEAVPEARNGDAYAVLQQAIREPASGETRSFAPGRWVRVSAFPGGSGILVYFRDIGESKAAAAALLAQTKRAEAAERAALEAHDRLEDAIETMSEGFVLYDAEDRLVLCNSRYREIYAESADLIAPGARFEDIIREGVRRGQYHDAIGREEAWIGERLAAHRAARGGFDQALPDGRWVRIIERRTSAGGTVGIRLDVTELRRREADLARSNVELERRVLERTRSLAAANEMLRRSEERYSALFEHSPTILYLLERAEDGGFVVADINPAGARACRVERHLILGKRMAELFDAKFAAAMEQRHAECAATGQPVEFEVSDEQEEGGVTWHVELVPLAAAEGGVARIFGTAIDLTEARRLEEQLREAQKMQAVGQLAGGVAHDFNNLLTAVLGNIELVLSHEEDARRRRLLQGALRAAERGAELTRQLLAYSRRQRLQEESVDLNERVRGMLDLLRRTLGPAITIEQRLDPRLWRVRADATQLELAILNLAINARDAMPEGGVLIIETANLPEFGPRRPRELPAGDFVSIAVRDHGVGMSEAVRAKAFEPFFTTKEVGKGSGLGLAQVYAFAEQSSGRTQIASRLGRGTTVTLWLPRSTGEVEARAAAEPDRASSGSGKVLIVDDEPEVREFAATSLRELGYEVAEATGGRAALDILDRGTPVDLLILDYAMPGMSGLELMQAARSRRPGLPLLLITGYAAGNLAETLGPGAAVLHKPFRQAELARAVERMLTDPSRVRNPAT